MDKEITYQTDDNVPRIISLIQKGAYIKVEATDDGVGLDNKAYSIDGKNWYENNSIAIDESKTYTVYVKDKLGNIATKDIQIDITQPEITNISVEGHTIKVTATDNVGLADKAYSLDKENWQSSNEIVVTKTGRYIVYVKDKSGNIANKLVVVGDEKKGSNNSNKSELIAQQDNSQSKNKLPQTGNMSTVIICAIVIICIVCIIIFKRIKRMRF